MDSYSIFPYVWLLSLSIIILRIIHIVVCIKSLFLIIVIVDSIYAYSTIFLFTYYLAIWIVSSLELLWVKLQLAFM